MERRTTAGAVLPIYLLLFLIFSAVKFPALAQDGSTGAVRGTVADATGARIGGARVMVTHAATGVARSLSSGDDGTFWAQMLPPGEYRVAVEAHGMARQQRSVVVELGAEVDLQFRLAVEGAQETVTVAGGEPDGGDGAERRLQHAGRKGDQ